MKASTSQIYMAAINLLSTSIVVGEVIPDDQILWAVNLAKRTASMIAENEEDETPTDEEITKAIKKAFHITNGKPVSKSQLINSIILIQNYRRMIAEYVVNRAEAIGIVKATQNGLRTDYTLA